MEDELTGRKAQFLKNVERIVAAYLEDDLLVCPHCGKNIVDPWAKAGYRYGICEPCYFRLQSDAYRQAIVTLEAKREYDAVRQKVHRLQKRKGKPCKAV